MKNSIFILAILICITSCKNNFDTDELDQILAENEALVAPEFYYRGTIEDQVNGISVPFNRVTEEIITEDLTWTSFVGSNSGQGTQSTNGYKFAISETGGSSITGVSGNSGPNDEDYVVFANNTIIAKIVSTQEGDNWYTRFSSEGLLSFMRKGETLSFGSEPGQVEIAFQHGDITGYPSFSEERAYYGLSIWSPDTSEDTFEILKIENYEDQGVQNPERGLKITAKINCSLGFMEGQTMKLKDVEATFLFLHN